MGVEITVEWPKDMESIFDSIIPPFFQAFGTAVINAIKDRTSQGIGVDGDAFDRYDGAYERYKLAIGRSPYSPGDWLFLTGQMMRSLIFNSVSDREIEIGFEGVRGVSAPKVGRKTITRGKRKGQKVTWAKQSMPASRNTTNSIVAYGNDQRRHFFSVNEPELELAIRDSFEQALQEFK